MNKILTEKRGAAGYLFFNRPDKWNAMDAGMLEEIQSALDAWEKDKSVRLLVISGKGKAFSSGVDLKALQALDTADQAREFAALLEHTAMRIFDFPKPVVAMVNGLALGGGFGMATAADIRIAHPEARIGYPAVKLGAILPAGCTLLLESLIGRGKAADLLLTGKQLTGVEAREMGLVEYVSGADDLQELTSQIIEKILEGGDTALMLTRRTLNHRLRVRIGEVSLYAVDNFAYLSQTRDWADRLKNFGQGKSKR